VKGYRAGEFPAPADEVARLAAQAAAIAADEQAALAGLGLRDGRALDVGCGPGFFAGGLQRAQPGLKLLGVDIDPVVLPHARSILPVVRGDVAALPFAEESFELVYARLLLRHVSDPLGALRAMVRLARKGGWVAAIDGWDASLHLHPPPRGFEVVAAARARWFRERGCCGDIGRRLPELLSAAGLGQLRVTSLQIDAQRVGVAAFNQIVLGPFLQAAAQALPPGHAPLADARAAVSRWTDDPAARGSLTLFVAAGQREQADLEV
jgi:SAM-dependent methyltransferase